MPLSNHEQRMLDEIERNLRDDDPEFAANASFDGQRRYRRHRDRVAGITFVLGMGVAMIGLITPQVPGIVSVVVSVAGFVAMCGAAGWLSLRQDRF